MRDGNSAEELRLLPEEPVHRMVKPVLRFLRIEAASGIILLIATAAALILANSRFAPAYFAFWSTPVAIQIGELSLTYSLEHVINDGLMTLFFFVVGLEIKRELVLGELRSPRVAALPTAAAIGGMLVPAAIYLMLQLGTPGERGWGVVMATDIAFVVGALALLGKRAPHSLRVFVLSLAIIDDIGAVLLIALVYSMNLNFTALGLTLLGVGVVLGLRKLGVRSIPVFYFFGILTWFAIDHSGIHPTVLGVVLGLLTPAHAWVPPHLFRAIVRRVNKYLPRAWRSEHKEGKKADLLYSVAIAAREALSPQERIENALHPWVSFLILPIFAFANAGVPITAEGLGEPLVLAVIAGLVLGKPIGILGASALAVRLRIATRPAELGWTVVGAAGVLCGMGFTMALFIANLAFVEAGLAAARLGVLAASAISAVLGFILLAAALRRRKTALA